MAGPQSFLDNLANLCIVMAVAVEHVQANRDEFIEKASERHVQQFRQSVSHIRTLADQLEQDFKHIESKIGERASKQERASEATA